MPLFKKNSEKQQINSCIKSTASDLKNLIDSIPSFIEKQKKKSKEERSTDLKALILTIIIISIIIFIFLKVPFLRNLLFK